MSTAYKLLPEAEKDLESIWRYTAKEWGGQQAMDYVDGLDDTFGLLVSNPNVNRQRLEFTPAVRIHHFKKHLIVYLCERS
jgi:toxin ParE1/3/4